MKYGDITLGQIEAIINKLGGEEGAMKFLRGEIMVSVPTRQWREEDGIIYFSVTSEGTMGPAWIERLERKNFRLSKYAKDVLRSPDFKPTSGVTTHIAVLKGMLFTDSDRVTRKIRAEAKSESRKFETPNAEVACLIREMFTDEDIEAMGLWWIVVMHDPIDDSDGDPDLLDVNRDGSGCWLNAHCDNPDSTWDRYGGFAFAVPHISSFLSRFCAGRVLFCQLSVPPAEHASRLIQFFG